MTLHSGKGGRGRECNKDGTGTSKEAPPVDQLIYRSIGIVHGMDSAWIQSPTSRRGTTTMYHIRERGVIRSARRMGAIRSFAASRVAGEERGDGRPKP